jgi:hypothetical protein
MEQALALLKEIFGRHYVALLALSVSWLGLYGAFRLLELLGRKLLVSLPLYLYIWIHRRQLGLKEWRAKVLGWSQPLAGGEVLSSQVGALSNSVDRRINLMRRGEYWPTMVLTRDGVFAELGSVRKRWAVLESDFALCRAVSRDERTSASGILSFIANPHNHPPDTRNLLLRALKYGGGEARAIALFHVGKVILDSSQVKQLEAAVSEWPEGDKRTAKEVTDNIRKQLAVAQAMSPIEHSAGAPSGEQ